MFEGYNKKANVIAYTDAEVAADWRLGMLRSTGQMIIESGTAEGILRGRWGSLTGFKEGSLASHLYPDATHSHQQGMGVCKAVSVTNLVEDTEERWEHGTFGSSSTTEAVVTGIVTCEHGLIGTMKYETSMGRLIYTIASKSSN